MFKIKICLKTLTESHFIRQVTVKDKAPYLKATDVIMCCLVGAVDGYRATVEW